MNDLFSFQNTIGAVMTGILGLLWLDIRKFRRDIEVKLEHKLDTHTHNLLCENATLKIREHIDAKLDDTVKSRREEMQELKREIIHAIKSNGD